MYLSPSPSNKKDCNVAEIQRMLNCIRIKFHHDWDYLTEDGIYWRKTANVVRQFQIYVGISSQMTPNGPILGDTTINSIRNYYNIELQISAESAQTLKQQKPRFLNENVVRDAFISLLQTFESFLKGQIDYARSLRIDNPNCLRSHYFSLASQSDKNLKNLKEKLQSSFNSRGAERTKNNHSARNSRKKLIQDLQKYNIFDKVDDAVKRFLSSKGIPTSFQLSFLKNKPSLTIKGGRILQFINYKDVVWDLCQFTEYGKEEWKADFKKDLLNLLDGLIVGIIGGIFAELIVAAGVAIAGVTISAGSIAILVAILATILCVGISWAMNKCDFSFAEILNDAYDAFIAPRIF